MATKKTGKGTQGSNQANNQGSGRPSRLSSLLGGGHTHQAAPPNNAGKTAFKQKMQREGELTELLENAGVEAKMYTGCSLCQANLDKLSQQKKIPLDKMNICPRCRATFVKEADVHCYSCGTVMDNGACLSCGAERADNEDLKIATVHIRMTRGLSGEDARIHANLLLSTKGPTLTRILADGRTDRIVDAAERTGQVGIPFGG